MKRLSRRTVLRGAGGVTLALPFLDAMRPRRAHAQGQAGPRRVMFVFKANGNEHATRFTKAGETDFVLGEFLAPLEPYRKEMLLINGLDKKYPVLGLGAADNHQQGGAALAPWMSGTGSFPIGGSDRKIGYVTGPSMDFVLGERVLKQHPSVKHRHLVYRVGQRHNNIWNVHSHGGPEGTQNPINPETDPYAAYQRIFASVQFGDSQPDPTVVKRLAKQQSALDLVLGEASALRSRLGTEDRVKLDLHLQSIKDIERILMKTDVPLVAACKAVPLGTKIDPYDDANHAIVGDLFFKISTMALACDLTRVVNFAWGGNTNGRVYKNLGIDEGHHDISHKSDATAFAKIRKINTHLWTQSVKLHEMMKAVPEGDKTLWDNTLIVHWNELGQGDKHSVNNDLVILTGGAHGHFKMGRLLEHGGKAAFSDALVNIFHYMGYGEVTRFGDPRLGTSKPLANLTA